MSIDPGALARLRVRLEEVLGVDDTAALLDPLTTVQWSKLVTTDDLERQLAESQAALGRQLAESRAASERQLAGSQAAFERRLGESQSKIRRDLLLVTGGQVFALAAAVLALA